MKNVLFICLLVTLSSCLDLSKVNKNEMKPNNQLTGNIVFQDFSNLKWLIGEWERTNNKEGYKTYENWKMESNKLFQGQGYTTKDGDLVFEEKLSLIADSSGLYYVVQFPNSKVTRFKFTELSSHSFVCENKNNEYPKIIKYKFSGENLTVRLSGGGPEEIFNFVPAQ